MGGVVLALDCAGKLGVANDSIHPGIPYCRTVEFEEGPRPFVLSEFRKWLVKKIDELRPDVIAVESPIPVVALGTSRFASEASARMLRGMIGVAEEVCGTCGIEWSEHGIMTVKKYFVGNGHADKAAMVARARQLRWQVDYDDNTSDACALWALEKSRRDKKFSLTSGPLFARASR